MCTSSLGIEIKSVDYSVTGYLTALKVQHGKIEMAKQPNHESGAATACALCLSEEMEGDDATIGLKRDSWFGNIETCT